jgi:hypothetical protein
MRIDYPSVIRESDERLRALERKHRGNGRVTKRTQMARLLKSGPRAAPAGVRAVHRRSWNTACRSWSGAGGCTGNLASTRSWSIRRRCVVAQS